MKILSKIFLISTSCSILLIFVFSLSIIFYERSYSAKFKNTSLKVEQNKFFTRWGKPDKSMGCNDCDKVFFYKTLFTYYAFTFDKNTKKLIHKYED
jgi:hypothetical protein